MVMPSIPELPPLLVRADASAAQGTGHVLRCLALAQAWRSRGGSVRFVTSSSAAPLRRRIQSAGAILVDVEEPYPARSDLNITISLLERLRSGRGALPWAVLDGYHFDDAYQSALRSAGCRLLVIDDNAHLPRYDADIVLNHGIHAPRLDYHAERGSWLLLGSRYALLRSEFARWGDFQRSQNKQAGKILVTLGGGDSENVTSTIIDALNHFREADEIEARILAGPLNPHLEELRKLATANPRITLETNLSDLAPLMAWADVAIAAAGTTAWELAFMQVPALLLVLAENQLAVAQGIDAFGAARFLGWGGDLSSAGIAGALQKLMGDGDGRALMARRGRALVDGMGVSRVINAMVERERFIPGADFSIRAADLSDSLLLWQWANDPITRRNSFNGAAISWQHHEAWCEQTLASSACRLWIAQIGALPAGQIRYDRIDARTAKVNFSIAAGFRGMQLGTRLLESTAELAARELAVCRIEAVVFAGNEASRRAFIKAGFAAAEERDIDGRRCIVFQRRSGASSRKECFVPVH